MVSEAIAECKRIVDACGDDLARASWYREQWIRETILSAPLDTDA